MEINENLSKQNKLVHTREQAKIVLDILSEHSDLQKTNLEDGIILLIKGLNNPKLNNILHDYPSLMQEYNLANLLSGNIPVDTSSRQDVKTAGLLSCLQLIINLYFAILQKGYKDLILRKTELYNANEVIEEYNSLKLLISSVNSEDFINEIFHLIIEIVGVEYYEKFQKEVQITEFILESALGFKVDSYFEKHLDLMIWFPLVRMFLEAIFICFNEEITNN